MLISLGNLVMNVRRSAWVGNGLDGSKVILTLLVREKSTVTLEAHIPLLSVARARMQIRTIVVALPDFNESVSNGFAR